MCLYCKFDTEVAPYRISPILSLSLCHVEGNVLAIFSTLLYFYHMSVSSVNNKLYEDVCVFTSYRKPGAGYSVKVL